MPPQPPNPEPTVGAAPTDIWSVLKRIATDAGETMARGVTRGVLSRFGVNPDALEKTEAVVEAGKNVIDEASPSKLAKQLANSLKRRFGVTSGKRQ